MHILTVVVECQSLFVLPVLENQSIEAVTECHEEVIFLAIEMAKAAGASLLSTLTLLATVVIEDELFQIVMWSFNKFTVILGLLGLVPQRDSFLGAMCRVAVPGCQLDVGSKEGPVALAGIFANRNTTPQHLSDRNMHFVRIIISTIDSLSGVLDSKTWYVIFETLQIIDGLVCTGKMGKKLESSPGLLEFLPSTLPTTSSRARAMTISSPLSSNPPNSQNVAVPYLVYSKNMYEQTKNLSIRPLTEFVRALCRLAHENITTSNAQGKEKNSDEKSYAIAKLHQLSVINIKRLIDPTDFSLWDLIIGQFIQMAQTPMLAPSVRNQTMQAFDEIMISAAQIGDLRNENVERKILEAIKTMMGLEVSGIGLNTSIYTEENSLRLSWLPEVQRASLETLNKLLQTNGQYFTTAWVLTLDIIQMVAKGAASGNMYKTVKKVETPTNETSLPLSPTFASKKIETPTQDSSFPGSPLTSSSYCESPTTEPVQPNSKSIMVTRVAFPCVQLITTDFLSLLPPSVIVRCIDTLTLYGSLNDDLNISLTAVGLMWSICDFILTKRYNLENQKAKKVKEGSENILLDNTDDAKLKNTISIIDLDTESAELSTATMDYMWMHLLKNLSLLCSDDRSEVRNSANQTLFRTIGMNGQLLTLEAWNMCIQKVLFPLLERIRNSSKVVQRSGSLNKIISPKLAPLGARSAFKQWDETKVITLAGVTKSLLDFLPLLVGLIDFPNYWKIFLDFMKTTCLEGSQEVSVAALKNLRQLVQYAQQSELVSEKISIHIIPLWTAAWETWESIGQEIIKSCQDKVGLSTLDLNDYEGQNEVSLAPMGPFWSDGTQPMILYGFMSQDSLAVYISIFFDLYPVIESVFDSGALVRVFDVLRPLLLYHTLPAPDATQSRMRADFVNDLESPSPFQMHILDLVGGKMNFSAIDSSPDLIISFVSDLVILPFIEFSPKHHCSSHLASTNDLNILAIPLKKFTYVAIAKKSLQQLVIEFELYGKRESTYLNGPFSSVLDALRIPLKHKYNCPKAGQRDSTPLWRAAANAAMTIINIGLDTLDMIEPRIILLIQELKLNLLMSFTRNFSTYYLIFCYLPVRYLSVLRSKN